MREQPKGGDKLKNAIRGALAASFIASMPVGADAAPRDKHLISQSKTLENPALRSLKIEWEKAKREEQSKDQLDRSKAWLTINSAFNEAKTPKERLDIIRYFGTKENTEEHTVAPQFFVGAYQKWKEGGRDASAVLQKLLEFDPYSAVTQAGTYANEPWAGKVLKKAGEGFPTTAMVHYGRYKSIPGAFGLLQFFIASPYAPRADSIAFIDSSPHLSGQEKQKLRSELPSDARIDFEIATSSQSDHFDEGKEFRKEVDTFPADTFPFELLKPLAERVPLTKEEANLYRQYYVKRSAHVNDRAIRDRIVERKMEALDRLSRYEQQPVEMSLNAMIVFRRLKAANLPITQMNISREVSAIRSERDRIKETDMHGSDTLLLTHGDIAKRDYPHHPKDTPYFSTMEQIETVKRLVEGKGYRFTHIEPTRELDSGRVFTHPVFAESAKEDALRWISGHNKNPIRVRFIGHGGPEGAFLSNGENIGEKKVHKSAVSVFISVSDLAGAIRHRHASGADTTKDVFVLDGCYQYDFILKIQSALTKENIPPPVFVSAAEKAQVTLIYPTTPFGPDVTKELTLAPKLNDILTLTKPGLRSHPSVFAPTREGGKWRGKQVSGTFDTSSPIA